MNDNEFVARIIYDRLDAGSPVVLVSIISSQGSAPRHSGSKMVVAADGSTYGTVGGGMMEAAAIAQSKKVLQERRSRLMDFDLEGEDASAKGPICGGTASLLLDFVSADGENADFFRAYHSLILKGKDFYFLTILGNEGSEDVVAGRSLLLHDGTLTGAYFWSEKELQAVKSQLHDVSATTVVSVGDGRVVVDPVRRTKTLYCLGAGHVAVPTAHIATLAGFSVTVVDDRPDFANTERFPDADRVVVTGDFADALKGLLIDSDSFVVIFTRGHRYDRVVLEQALKTGAGYIGMIGSVRKRDAIYAALSDEGVTLEELKRVHSPIGLPINAETPEEIAVSIVAELIAERAKQQA